MNEYDEKCEQYERELRPLLTPEFLRVLVAACRTCGWYVDHTETMDFVRWCHDAAGQPKPDWKDLKPFAKP